MIFILLIALSLHQIIVALSILPHQNKIFSWINTNGLQSQLLIYDVYVIQKIILIKNITLPYYWTIDQQCSLTDSYQQVTIYQPDSTFLTKYHLNYSYYQNQSLILNDQLYINQKRQIILSSDNSNSPTEKISALFNSELFEQTYFGNNQTNFYFYRNQTSQMYKFDGQLMSIQSQCITLSRMTQQLCLQRHCQTLYPQQLVSSQMAVQTKDYQAIGNSFYLTNYKTNYNYSQFPIQIKILHNEKQIETNQSSIDYSMSCIENSSLQKQMRLVINYQINQMNVNNSNQIVLKIQITNPFACTLSKYLLLEYFINTTNQTKVNKNDSKSLNSTNLRSENTNTTQQSKFVSSSLNKTYALLMKPFTSKSLLIPIDSLNKPSRLVILNQKMQAQQQYILYNKTEFNSQVNKTNPNNSIYIQPTIFNTTIVQSNSNFLIYIYTISPVGIFIIILICCRKRIRAKICTQPQNQQATDTPVSSTQFMNNGQLKNDSLSIKNDSLTIKNDSSKLNKLKIYKQKNMRQTEYQYNDGTQDNYRQNSLTFKKFVSTTTLDQTQNEYKQQIVTNKIINFKQQIINIKKGILNLDRQNPQLSISCKQGLQKYQNNNKKNKNKNNQQISFYNNAQPPTFMGNDCDFSIIQKQKHNQIEQQMKNQFQPQVYQQQHVIDGQQTQQKEQIQQTEQIQQNEQQKSAINYTNNQSQNQHQNKGQKQINEQFKSSTFNYENSERKVNRQQESILQDIIKIQKSQNNTRSIRQSMNNTVSINDKSDTWVKLINRDNQNIRKRNKNIQQMIVNTQTTQNV